MQKDTLCPLEAYSLAEQMTHILKSLYHVTKGQVIPEQ